MSIDLTNKAALITGASRGLGRAMALCMAGYGANVLVHYRKEAALAEEVVSSIRAMGRRAVAMSAEITDLRALEAMGARALEEFGRIDVLVANAGTNSRLYSVVDTPLADWERLIRTNLLGVVHTVKAIVPHLRRGGGGSVVLISSVEAEVDRAYHAPYATTKTAVNVLGRILAKEEARHCIRVNVVAPGLAAAGLGSKVLADLGPEGTATFMKDVLMGRPGEASEVAEAVAFLASDAASYITGAVLPVDGGCVERGV